tara:strand:+ start:554 stop:1294 length:741 start_codon:yes stop_codon:yes gene_type:complete
MIFKILTLFPEMFDNFKEASIIGRAVRENKIDIETVYIRDYANNKHNRVDDYPYGGGAGMVMQALPLKGALEASGWSKGKRVIYMSPKGKPLTQALCDTLSKDDEIYIVCGHYEGIDQRFIDHYVTEEISIGDYVLTGGELPAMVLVDSVARLLPGVLGKQDSYEDESHMGGLLEYPQYTRPADFEGTKVPDILLSGHHANIEKWRLEESVLVTMQRRPDMIDALLASPDTDPEIIKVIHKIKNEK